ncbi:MAG: hypothetical protein P1V97_06805 [Planctomycetota bacterium]|nr:hypothetical protein [Planctomycetota bacterium]
MRKAMQLRPRMNEQLKCAYCLEAVTATVAEYLKEIGSPSKFASLAVHKECAAEMIGKRFIIAPLAYGIAERVTTVMSLEALDAEDLMSEGAIQLTKNRFVLSNPQMNPEHNKFVMLRQEVELEGELLQPMQIAAEGKLTSHYFLNVYESLAIHAGDSRLRLCLHDSVGLKIERGLVFSGGRMLSEGVYHSSVRMSESLVTLSVGGLVSIVYERGDFMDVEGGMTMSRAPAHLPRPDMGRGRSS